MSLLYLKIFSLKGNVGIHINTILISIAKIDDVIQHKQQKLKTFTWLHTI